MAVAVPGQSPGAEAFTLGHDVINQKIRRETFLASNIGLRRISETRDPLAHFLPCFGDITATAPTRGVNPAGDRGTRPTKCRTGRR